MTSLKRSALARGLISASTAAVFILAGYQANAQSALPSDAEAATRKLNADLLKELSFDDRQSFEDARKGFVAAPAEVLVKAPDGRVIYSSKPFDFSAAGTPPETVNPSLWRQSQLNAIFGLFRISDRVYQIRGFDISNMTIIEGESGLIVIDTLLSAEAARNALDFYFEKRPRRPISSIIYTHSHADHYGGVRGLISEKEAEDGKTRIIAPRDFLEPAVSETILAGNAMARRLQYQFGLRLPRNEKGLIDGGLGKDLSRSSISLIPPTEHIGLPFESKTIDGVQIDFMLTPGAEAPTEMIMYLPQFKVLHMAELTTQVMHNIYTPRGAEVRDANAWAKRIDDALRSFGDKADVLIASHTWPVWGTERIKNFLAKQRNLYKFMHDQSVRLLNQGYLGTEIADRVKLPKSLSKEWSVRGYYGTLSHNVRGVYQKYLGFYTSNPADLDPLPPTSAAKKFVEYMGGADQILRRAREDYRSGEYRWVAQVLNQLVYSDPDNKEAKELEAAALEQLGYQSESAIWRNEYLMGAYELRNGRPRSAAALKLSPDTVRSLTPEMIFDYLAVKVNGDRAADKKIVINWHFSDSGLDYSTNLEDSALTYRRNYRWSVADIDLTLSRETLNKVLLKDIGFDLAISSGQIKLDGNPIKFSEFVSLLDEYELMYGIVTPDRGPQ